MPQDITPRLYANGYYRHKSIIAYLAAVSLPKSAAAVREELQIGDGFDDATRKKYEGLLEKKWTSVVRLQKKVWQRARDAGPSRC